MTHEHRKKYGFLQTLRIELVLLAIFATLLVVSTYLPRGEKSPFVSSEVEFTDQSRGGLDIMPASCASSPTYFHTVLSATPDGYGFVLPVGASEVGNYSIYALNYVCVSSNTSGNSYFIPSKTAAELNAFKTNKPAGVTVY